MKKVIVISLGGSLIIPEEIDVKFLEQFKKIILKNTKNYKFVVICGGGSIARKYISALEDEGINEKMQSFAGISATRMNARFVSYFFNTDPEKGIPEKIKSIEEYLKKQDIVFCGALEYHPNQTSDSTSAQIAQHFKTEFINLTNVPGLYDRNPIKSKTLRCPSEAEKRYRPSVLRGESAREIRGFSRNAKFIPEISWKNFYKMTNKIKFKPGQHFVLDQKASKIIMENKIPTYILGKDMNQLDNLLNNKKFRGTIIEG